MIHLRIVVPGPRSERVVGLLEAGPSVSSLARLDGASHKPPGDLVLCDMAREDANFLAFMVLAGVATLLVQNRVFQRRRARHLHDSSRALAGLPTTPRPPGPR